MSDDIARDIELLTLVADKIRQCVQMTMMAGDSEGAEIGNNLEEALGKNDPRFGDVWRCITTAEQHLDDYKLNMMEGVDRIHRIVGALRNLR
jgi:hypothetical protein